MVANISLIKGHRDLDLMRITKKGIILGVNMFRFIDKETRQVVLYVPSIEVSGYGSTIEKAKEMLQVALTDFCKYLFDLPSKDRQIELQSLGWKPKVFKNKEFSKAYVDVSGELRNLNADENSVERLTLEAA